MAGSGKTVVLIHGVFFARDMWRPQVERLASEFRVVTIDLPGHGELRSQRFTIEAAVDWLFDVLDRVGSSEAALVGLSLGGYVALSAAGREPAGIPKLILSGTTREPKSFTQGPFRLVERALALAPAFVTDRVASAAVSALFPERVAVDLLAATVSIPEGMRALQALPGSGFKATLREYPGQVLFLNGRRDFVFRPQEASFLEAARRGRLTVIDRAGHLVPLEMPDAFADQVSRFARGDTEKPRP